MLADCHATLSFNFRLKAEFRSRTEFRSKVGVDY